jgi:hypothetical protein
MSQDLRREYVQKRQYYIQYMQIFRRQGSSNSITWLSTYPCLFVVIRRNTLRNTDPGSSHIRCFHNTYKRQCPNICNQQERSGQEEKKRAKEEDKEKSGWEALRRRPLCHHHRRLSLLLCTIGIFTGSAFVETSATLVSWMQDWILLGRSRCSSRSGGFGGIIIIIVIMYNWMVASLYLH